MTEAATGSPLGIFGGTFDPVHYGHLRLAEDAVIGLGLPRVRWIPAGQPALRDAPRVSAAQRLAMVRLAIEGNPCFEIDSGEVDRQQTSYTVTTLERLRASLGKARPLVLLLGADAFAGLAGWHRWPELFEWIADNKAAYILQKRLSSGAVQELLNEGTELPGVTTLTRKKLNLRAR